MAAKTLWVVVEILRDPAASLLAAKGINMCTKANSYEVLTAAGKSKLLSRPTQEALLVLSQ